MNLITKNKGELRTYNHLDRLPIEIWFKVHKSKDLTLLCIDKKEKYSIEKLNKLWDNLNDEYIDLIGLPENMENNLKARQKAAIYKARFIIEGKRHFLTHADIELQKVKEEKIKKDSVSLEENLGRLSKFMGFKLSGMKTMTTEYYNYLKIATDGTR